MSPHFRKNLQSDMLEQSDTTRFSPQDLEEGGETMREHCRELSGSKSCSEICSRFYKY